LIQALNNITGLAETGDLEGNVDFD